MTSAQRTPDISFVAHVAAREMLFDDEPEARVAFTGTAESESSSDRVGIEDPVQAGTRYRDVRVEYRLNGTIRDPLRDQSDDEPHH